MEESAATAGMEPAGMEPAGMEIAAVDTEFPAGGSSWSRASGARWARRACRRRWSRPQQLRRPTGSASNDCPTIRRSGGAPPM